MIDLLGIISNREFIEDFDTDIRVVNNNKSPFIEYKTKNSEGIIETNTINKIDPILAKASDLDYLLKSRTWNTPERKFIDGQKNLCIYSDKVVKDFIPVIYTSDIEGEYRLSENSETIHYGTVLNSVAPGVTEVIDDVIFGEILSIDEEVPEGDETVINGFISPLNKIRKQVSNWRRIESNERKKNSITEDTLHSILTRNQEKISGGSVDIISKGSGIYTNIVNLNHYLEVNSIGIDKGQKILARLCVEYSKKINGVVERFSREISFYPFIFSYDTSKILKAISDNFIREINGDIVIEFINGCARVFATNKNVTECIISFCNLNYE